MQKFSMRGTFIKQHRPMFFWSFGYKQTILPYKVESDHYVKCPLVSIAMLNDQPLFGTTKHQQEVINKTVVEMKASTIQLPTELTYGYTIMNLVIYGEDVSFDK